MDIAAIVIDTLHSQTNGIAMYIRTFSLLFLLL